MSRCSTALTGAGSVLTRAGTGLAAAGAAHALLNSALLRRPARSPAPVTDRVCVLLPVRDEADQIGPCLRAVLAQRDVPGLEVLVLDDESSDDTAELARRVAGDDPRVRIVSGAPTPPGWLGKPHACWQLAQLADSDSSVLIFLDADVRLEPDAVLSTVDIMRVGRLDFVSPYPRLEAGSAAERLIQPLLPWSWLTFLPLRLAERSSRPALTAAGGQLLAISRSSYQRCGGHRAVRGDVLEDLALARRAKKCGARGGVVDGSMLASCRMYDTWPGLRDGYGKSLWHAFGSTPGAAAVFGLLGLAYLVPPIAALRGSRTGQIGYLAAIAGRTVAARRTGGQALPDALAHPASIVLAGWLTARSVVTHRRGTVRWKGRRI